jgi:hypothetical protein
MVVGGAVALAGVSGAIAAGGGMKAVSAPEFIRAGVVNDKVKGIVVAHEARNGRARVVASLHGVEPQTEYVLAGRGGTGGFHFLFGTGRAAQDVFVTELVAAPKAQVDRAVLLELGDGGATKISVFGMGGGVDDDR